MDRGSVSTRSLASRQRIARLLRARGIGAGQVLMALIPVVLAWEVVARLIQFRFFPPFSNVFGRLIEMLGSGEIAEHLGSSLSNLVIGFAIAVVFGVGIGAVMGRVPAIGYALSPLVHAMIAAPTLAFAPILFAVFGVGTQSIVLLIVLFAVFIIIAETFEAVKSVPEDLIEMARVFGAGDRRLLRDISIPSSTPLILAGVRIGAAQAVKGMINGEMFIAVVGLGAISLRASRQFDTETVLAILLLLIGIAFAAVGTVHLVDRRVTSWLPSTHRNP